MTWVEYNAALQLLAEEQVGVVLREVEREEDAAFFAARKALGG